jgi:penicillin amidase
VTTVCSTTPDANFAANLGASYRMVADLADPRMPIRAVNVAGVSGHPGSPHYDDQIAPWSAGENHELTLSATGQGDRRWLVLAPSN